MSDFMCYFFFFKQKTAYEMRISDWSSDVCSSDLTVYMRGVTPFRGHLIIEERVHGLDQIRLRRYSGEEHRIAFPEASYTASLGSNPEFAPAAYRIGYTSMVTPVTVYDYQPAEDRLETLKVQELPSGYDKSHYESARTLPPHQAGQPVPVSGVYQKG